MAAGFTVGLKYETVGLKYEALQKECLDAVRQWPGCESVAGIQIIRLEFHRTRVVLGAGTKQAGQRPSSTCPSTETAGFGAAVSALAR